MNLLPKQFLVDQAIERGLAVSRSKGVKGSTIDKSLVRSCFFPVALENRMAVHGSDDAVNYITGTGRIHGHE